MMLIILLLFGAVILLYKFAIKPRSYWKQKNIQATPFLPLFGDNLHLFLGKESFMEMMRRIYNTAPGLRYIGSMQFQTPCLVLRSPELIKQICVKDFDHFLNRRNVFSEDSEELMSKNLVSLKGLAWKEMRSTISPSFTSSKMRLMLTLISQNAEVFAQYFLDKNEPIVEIEFKDAFTRYSNDVIANVAFGLHVDSLKERKNEFYMMGKKVTDFKSLWKRLILFLYLASPGLAGYLKLSFFGKDTEKFFLKIVKDTIKMREEQNIKRPDMLGLLLEARKGKHQELSTDEPKDNTFAAVEEHLEMINTRHNLTDFDITAQLFIFFFAGFDVVSSAMCFMAYELAVNPDVQTKLIEEIDANRPPTGTPSYEKIVNMTYLDMVVTETLRKWPIAVATDRVVNKPYTIEPQSPEEKPIFLERGDYISVPICGIHYDPKYYENPEKFDPERFSPENRRSIDPYTYLPFGVGPRNCIGSRFALLEIKAVFCSLLSHFEIVPVKKTMIPLQLDRKSINVSAVNGFPLGLKRRF